MKPILIAMGLFAITAVAEIFGCYAVLLWWSHKRSALWCVAGALSLALFAWLLTLHPTAAGRTYAAYGGIYIAAAMVWLRFVDGQPLDRWDWLGAVISIIGTLVILIPHVVPSGPN
jgi:small multidrug resistance family-3 protein